MQVGCDFRQEIEISDAVGETAQQAEHIQNWKRLAVHFLQRSRGKGDKLSGYQKLYRRKAYEWLLAVDNVLRVMTARSLQDFLLPREQSPTDWSKFLVLNIDQGSDGWCARNFLKSRGLAMATLFDDSHRRWNNGINALKDREHEMVVGPVGGSQSCM